MPFLYQGFVQADEEDLLSSEGLPELSAARKAIFEFLSHCL